MQITIRIIFVSRILDVEAKKLKAFGQSFERHDQDRNHRHKRAAISAANPPTGNWLDAELHCFFPSCQTDRPSRLRQRSVVGS